jgi:hypothetical protein
MAEAPGVRETHPRQTRQGFDSCPDRFGSTLGEIEGHQERIVVGSRYRAVHLGLIGRTDPREKTQSIVRPSAKRESGVVRTC